MASKSIKQLVVKVETTGADSALKELKSLNTTLESAVSSSKAFTRETLAASKYMGQAVLAYRNVNKAIEESTASVKKLNSAMNGDTAKAQKGINAYIDNLQILNTYLKDVAKSAKTAGTSLSSVGAGSSSLDVMTDLLFQLTVSVEATNENLEALSRTMKNVEENTGRSTKKLKDVKKYISDLDVTTNRGNETLEEMAYRFEGAGVAAESSEKKAKKYNNTLKNLNGTGSQSARAFSKLAFDMNPLTAAYATIAINVYALSEAFRVLKDAAALDRLANQTAQFSASISGINVKSLAAEMQRVSGGALALGESLKQAVRGVSFNFMSEDLIRLTEGARKASVALGIDFTDAMDRVIRGISKGEVELLDELGVVTRLDTAYRKYASTLGINADQLTDYQRKVALTNEVLKQLEEKYVAFDVAANSTERLGVATKNFIDNLAINGVRALDKYISKLARLMEGLAPQASATKQATESLKIYNEALKSGNIDQARVAWYEYIQITKKAREENTIGTAAYKKLQEQASATADAIDTVTISLVALVAWMNRALIMSAVVKGFALFMATTTALAGVISATGTALATLFTVLRTGATVVAAIKAAVAAAGVAFAAFSAPIWGTVAVIAAVVAGIGALIKWLAPDVFSYIVKGASDALSYFVDKLKDLALWVGKVTGLTDLISDIAGVEKASLNAANAMDKLAQAKLAANSKEAKAAGAFISSLIPDSVTEQVKKASDWAEDYWKNLEIKAKKEAEIGLMNQAYAKNMAEAASKTKDIARDMDFSKNNLQEMALAARGLVSEISLETGLINPDTIEKAKDMFEDLKASGLIAKDAIFDNGKGLEDFAKSAYSAGNAIAYLTRSRAVMEEQFATSVMGDQYEGIKILEKQIELDRQRLSLYQNLGSSIDKADKAQLENNIAINEEKIKQLELTRKLEAIENSFELAGEASLNQLKLRSALESEIVAQKILLLKAEIEAKKALNQTKEVAVLEQKLALLKEERNFAYSMEEIERSRFEMDKQLAALQKTTDRSLNERERVINLQKELDFKRQMIEADKTLNSIEKERALFALSQEQSSLDGKKSAALFSDVSGAASGIAGLEGLTDLQSQFSSTVSDISDTYSTFLSDMEGSGLTFTDYLKGNVEAMSQVMQASVSLAGQAFKTMSDEKIAGIDREIEAEKRRDGKSAESLAKIKALEAKKIKEEAKAKKASVIMSTAAGAMQAFAQMGPFGAPFAAAITAMGMLQLASIDRAANGQLAALNDGGGSSLSITGGNRSNEIDVNKKANAGELAYLQGMSGTGTANNFTPGKAVGGYARAGASIVVGESGPETITPAIPVNVSPAGQSGQQPAIVFSPVINASAVDTEGMESLLDRYSRQLFDSLEKEMNARNRSLESL